MMEMMSSLVRTLIACIDIQAEFGVDPVTADITEVISLFGEEELVDDTAGGFFIRRLSIAELAVDILDGFLFRVGGIFLQCIEDDGVFAAC